MLTFFFRYKFAAFLLVILALASTVAAKINQPSYSRFFTLKTHIESPLSSHNSMTLDNQYLYLGTGKELMRFDLTNTTAPIPNTQLLIDYPINDIVVQNGRLYVLTTSSFMVIDTATFQVLGEISYIFNTYQIAIISNRAYLDGIETAHIIDITNAFNLFEIKSIPATMEILAYDEARMIGLDENQLEFWSLQNPDNPVLVHIHPIPSETIADAALQGQSLYVLSSDYLGCEPDECTYRNYWDVFNISDLTNPVQESRSKLFDGQEGNAFSIQDDLLYIGMFSGDIAIFAITHSQPPKYSTMILGKGSIEDVATTPNLLLAHTDEGINFYDRATLNLTGTFDQQLGRAHEVAWGEGFVLAYYDNVLLAVDVTQPSKATILSDFDGLLDDSNLLMGIQANSHYAYISTFNNNTFTNWLHIFDVVDPTQPALVSSYQIPMPYRRARHAKMILDGDNLYILWHSVINSNNGLITVDISDPTQPTAYVFFPINRDLSQVTYHQNTLYTDGCVGNNSCHLFTLDVSDPMHIQETETNINLYDTTRFKHKQFAILNQHLYITSNPMEVYDLAVPTQPQLVEPINLERDLAIIGAGNSELYLLAYYNELLAFNPQTSTITAVRHLRNNSTEGDITLHDNQLILLAQEFYLFDMHMTDTTIFLPIAAKQHIKS